MGTEPNLVASLCLSYPPAFGQGQGEQASATGQKRSRRGERGPGGGRGPGGEGRAREGQEEREEPGGWSTTLASTHSAHENTFVGPCSTAEQENPSLKAKFLLTLMCGTAPTLNTNTLYCSRL